MEVRPVASDQSGEGTAHYPDDTAKWVIVHVVVALAVYAVLGFLAWVVLSTP